MIKDNASKHFFYWMAGAYVASPFFGRLATIGIMIFFAIFWELYNWLVKQKSFNLDNVVAGTIGTACGIVLAFWGGVIL